MSLPPPSRSTQARPRRGAGLWPAITLFLVCLACFQHAFSADLPLKDQPHLRRPIAAAWIEANKLLAIANQKSGSISLIDFGEQDIGVDGVVRSKNVVLEEIAVGERLSDIAVHASKKWIFVTDERQHELIVLEFVGNALAIRQRHPVSPFPRSIAISANGSRISVASLWSRKITIFELTNNEMAANDVVTKSAAISLPFNPLEQGFMGGNSYVVVKDAFARRYVEVNVDDRVASDPSGKGFWPQLPEGESYDTRSYPRVLKDMGLGAIYLDGQEMLVSYGRSILLGPAPPLSPADRGEELFHSQRLSADGKKSCYSCHVDGHTNYQLADTLGDDTTGTPKRIPTLLGTRLTDPWAWNGKQRDLSEQVRKSLETTMHAKAFTQQQVGDLVAYLHTLDPPPPLEPATDGSADEAQLARGQALFQNLGCAKCHVPPLTYTSPDAYDVGLTDEKGLTKFNPPSLRGVSQGYTFFHDGRAKSLEEVFTVHGHMLDRTMSDNELADLLRFLRSL